MYQLNYDLWRISDIKNKKEKKKTHLKEKIKLIEQ
jgi:hypothetical protein